MIISWKLTLFILSVLIFILTFPQIGLPIRTGLDESFYFADNYLFSNNFRYGREIIFPFGPLGFLLTPQNFGNNLLFSIIVISIFRLSLIYLALRLFIYGKKFNRLNSVFGIITIFFFANTFDGSIFGIGSLFIFNIALLFLCYLRSQEKRYLIFAAFFLAITFFTQINYFLNALSLMLGLIVFGLTDKNFTDRIKYCLLIITAFILNFVIIWFILYGNLNGLVNYGRGLIEISSGFGSSMTLSANNNILILFISLALFISAFIFSREKRVKKIFLIFLFPLYLSFRYSLGRQDIPHEHFFSDYLVLFYFLMLIFSQKFLFKTSLFIFLSILIYGLHMQYLPGKEDPGFVKYTFKRTLRIDGAGNFSNIILNFAGYKKSLDRESNQNLTEKKLSAEMLNLIGKNTLDVYPWEVSVIAANDLNWRPRPVYQSYVAFTPWLDDKNEQFIKSLSAPEFILFDRNHAGGEVESIDGRSLFNDEPKTWASIVRNYSVVREEDNSILLQRKKTVAFHQAVNMEMTYSRWNKWIQVPKMNGGILRAEISFRRNIFGRLKKLFWKDSQTFIEYNIDGKIERHRLVLENASSGIWIEPFMMKLSLHLSGSKVSEIRIIHQDAGGFDPDITIDWLWENYPFDT